MRSFRDRNPYAIGIASVLVIGAFVGFAFMVGILHLLEDTYPVKAVFNDAAGIRSGDQVKLAGVQAGRVTGIEADRRKGTVLVKMVINKGVRLDRQARAEIALGTLLGAKFVRLSGVPHPPYLEDLDEAQRVIPVSRTKTPFDVFDLTTISAKRVEATDNEKLNKFITQLADITQGNASDIRTLLESVNTIAAAVNQRDAQFRELFDRFDQLTKLLSDKDQTLVQLLDQSKAVLELVRRRRADIASGLNNTDRLATELSRLLAVNKSKLDAILDTLHPTLDLVQAHQEDLDRALAWLGPGAYGLATAASHGPWNDIYVRAIGPDLLQVINDVLGGGSTAEAAR